MDYIIGKFADTLMNKVVEITTDELDGIFESNKLRRILLKNFKSFRRLELINNPKSEPICYIDRKAIMSVDSKLIMPNLTIEELENNLTNVFDKCIITDNNLKTESIKKIICSSYLNDVSDFIKISQIDKDIQNVNKVVMDKADEMSKELGKFSNHLKQMNENVMTITRELKVSPQQQLIFLDELDNSRMYCYISLQLTTDIDNDFLMEIASNICAQPDKYENKNGLINVDFDFFEPIVQCELKEFLEYIDEEFSENNIGILRIISHN